MRIYLTDGSAMVAMEVERMVVYPEGVYLIKDNKTDIIRNYMYVNIVDGDIIIHKR